MSSNEIAIQVEGLGKCYQIYNRPQDRLKQFIKPRLQALIGRDGTNYFREFWALKEISFEVMRGETVGIIGRNGSGKSTLLQIICGTLSPTVGHVETWGRVAALLELGAGFNPEFTGRENVYMNAAILGLSQEEVDIRFDNIASFADIGEFIEQPVKHYSSGMYARLAFAVAINVDPKILVVDEALSVGDEPFQRKCFARINKMKDEGSTILFVSHSGGTIINLCDRAILLNRGEKIFSGMPKRAVFFSQQLGNTAAESASELIAKIRLENSSNSIVLSQDNRLIVNDLVIGRELVKNQAAGKQASIEKKLEEVVADKVELVDSINSVFDKREEEIQPFMDASFLSQTYSSYEPKGARIEAPGLYTIEGEKVNHIVRGSRYILRCTARFFEDCKNIRFYALIRTTEGIDLAGCAHPPLEDEGIDVDSGSLLMLSFEFMCALNPASYFCNFAIQGSDGSLHHRIVDALAFRVISEGCSSATGIVDLAYIVSIYKSQ